MSVLAEKPEVHFPKCFLSDVRPYTKLFPRSIDPYICATYEAIQELPQHPAANALIAQLLRFGVTFVGIVTFEGSRQTSFWLKQSDFYLFIAQATSGAAAIPAYFAAIHEKTIRPPKSTPEDAWASFIGVLVGFLLPIAYGIQTGWQGNALNAFLFYPVFIWVIRQLSWEILQPWVKNQSYKLPLLLQASVGVIVSASSQSALYRNFTLMQVLQPKLGIDLVQDLHAMLLADFAITATALLSHVILYSYRGESMELKVGVVVVTVLFSLFLGPGGAISVAWCFAELKADRRSVSERIAASRKKKT